MMDDGLAFSIVCAVEHNKITHSREGRLGSGVKAQLARNFCQQLTGFCCDPVKLFILGSNTSCEQIAI